MKKGEVNNALLRAGADRSFANLIHFHPVNWYRQIIHLVAEQRLILYLLPGQRRVPQQVVYKNQIVINISRTGNLDLISFDFVKHMICSGGM